LVVSPANTRCTSAGRPGLACLLAAVGVTSVCLVAATTQSTSASPSLTIRARLVRCLNAVNGLYVGRVKPRTARVAILNRKARVVDRRCFADTSVLGTKAGRALFDLSLGMGYYRQYLHDLFEHPSPSLLRKAHLQIALGKAEAKEVLHQGGGRRREPPRPRGQRRERGTSQQTKMR
jgi:hypothetical protein